MNKALQILSFTLFVFLVSCEAEFPISLEPTIEEQVSQGSESAFMVSQSKGEQIKGEYLVMFKEDLSYLERLDEQTLASVDMTNRSTRSEISSVRAERETSIKSFLVSTLNDHHIQAQTIEAIYDIGRMKGGLVSMSEEDAVEMAQDERIASVEPNELIALNLTPGAKGHLIPADDGPSKQWTTYNINAIGGTRDHSNKDTWAFIIDSGIDLDHPDLNVNKFFSRSFVPYENDADDGFGHGTHVAGIIGAKNNGSGVVGVASGATLVGVKVLDRNGYGSKDYLMQALSYVAWACIPGDVVNISLGTDKSNLINNAILNLKNQHGVFFTIAAGNSARDAKDYSPANLMDANIHVVGAINIYNWLTNFSNYGSSVGFLAPGAGIYSTYKDGQYAWMDGTSMAAPHVAGILLVSNGQYRVKKQIKLPCNNYAKIISQY
ncbi:MAG: S8 family serine peptidase [Bacteroidota bacterium]